MIVAVDLERVADLALAEADRHPPRSPERRAASHLWISLTVPPAKSIAGARNAIATFGDEHTQAAALELLHRLAATAAATRQETP